MVARSSLARDNYKVGRFASGRGASRAQLANQGIDALADEDGDQSVDPPGDVATEGHDVDERDNGRNEEDGTPEHDEAAVPGGDGAERAEDGVVPEGRAAQVQDEEDDRIDAVRVAGRLHEGVELGENVVDHQDKYTGGGKALARKG